MTAINARAQRRLKSFADDGKRRKFVNSLYSQIPPNSSIDLYCRNALDEITKRFARRDYSKPLGIVEAMYSTEISPTNTRDKSSNHVQKYDIRTFNILHTLERTDHACTGKMEVDVYFNPLLVRYDYIFNGKRKVLKLPMDGIAYLGSFMEERFNGAKGAALKITGAKGIFSLGGVKRNLSVDNKHSPIFIFFEQGKVFYFNIKGERINPVKSAVQAIKNKKKNKIKKSKVEIDKFNLDDYIDSIIVQARDRWKVNPGLYTGFGRNYIFEGRLNRKTDKRGRVNITLYRGENKIPVLIVGKEHPYKEVELNFKGPYVAINNKARSLLNVHSYKPYLWYKILNHDPSDLEILAIATSIKHGALRISAGGRIYAFSVPELEEKVERGFEEFEHKGIMAHVNPKTCNYFEILLLDKGGKFTAQELEPLSVWGKDGQRLD